MHTTAADLWTVAQTIWGEARGEPYAGQVAVAHVIRNRSLQAQRSPMLICIAPKQFSCWNQDDPNQSHLGGLTLDDPSFALALRIAVEVFGNLTPDPTLGSRHYHAREVTPRWAKGHTACLILGNHMFYNDVA